jgi:uncharacterized protein (TIGR03437 family)
MIVAMYRLILKTALPVLLLTVARPLAPQTTQTEAQFITSVNSAVSAFTSTLGSSNNHFIFSAALVPAYGSRIPQQQVQAALNYIDGLKAVGVQRVEFNPGVTSMSNPAVVEKYDAIVRHIRELGMRLSINPEYETGVDPPVDDFSQYQTLALAEYPVLAARYHPDNFVIVHEPTTMTGRMGIGSQTTTADWHDFIVAAIPLIKKASPATRVGAGCSYNTYTSQTVADTENTDFEDFVTISGLDFMTMDIYSLYFNIFTQWAQLAHQNGKGVYIEETWAPHYLPPTRPAGTQGESLDQISLVGPANSDFSAMDIAWLQAMSQFASSYQMEAVTAYTSETFFYYGASGADKPSEGAYWTAMVQAVENGKLTPTGQAYLKDQAKWSIPELASISSASYPTLPTPFNPACGTAGDPCNPLTVAAPDALMSAFGVDLSTSTQVDGTFPTKLGGTTMTLVDSSNTSFPLQMFSVSSGQVNYYVPATAQPGPATITVTSGDGTQTTGTVLIAPSIPGLYTANANGQGAASAIAICSGTCSGWPNPIGHGQFYQFTFTCGSTGCDPQPISWGSNDTVVVELFGTGIRHAAAAGPLTAEIINGPALPIAFAGPQGDTGLDQVNIQLPQNLAGSGQIQLMLTVQYPAQNLVLNSNAVVLEIK